MILGYCEDFKDYIMVFRIFVALPGLRCVTLGRFVEDPRVIVACCGPG